MMNMMKRVKMMIKKSLLIIMLCFILIGCGKVKKSENNIVFSAYEIDVSAKMMNIPEDVLNKFNEAKKEILVLELEPVSILGTQVVSGTNYLILCKATSIEKPHPTNYQVVTMYVDLEGKSKITGSKEFNYSLYVNRNIDIDSKLLVGGYTVYTQIGESKLEKNIQEIFNKSTNNDKKYSPILLFGKEKNDGTNYAVLTLENNDNVNSLNLLTIHEGNDGSISILSDAFIDLKDFTN